MIPLDPRTKRQNTAGAKPFARRRSRSATRTAKKTDKLNSKTETSLERKRHDFKAPLAPDKVEVINTNLKVPGAFELLPRKSRIGYSYIYSKHVAPNPSLDFSRQRSLEFHLSKVTENNNSNFQAKLKKESNHSKTLDSKTKQAVQKIDKHDSFATQTSKLPALVEDRDSQGGELAKLDNTPSLLIDDWKDIDESEAVELLNLQPSWRYAWWYLLCFVGCSMFAISLSDDLDFLALTNNFSLLGFDFKITFPLLILPAAFFLFKAFFKVYNQYATMSDKTLRLHTGVLTLNAKIVEMETDTMLVVQCSQSPIDKLLSIGTVSIGRFSRKNMEVDIPGVLNPHANISVMKERIKAARERKAKLHHSMSLEMMVEEDSGE